MENVTAIFHNFREHTRHLQNTAFSETQFRYGNIEFADVYNVLFNKLVLARIPSLPYELTLEWEEKNAFLIEPSGGGFCPIISSERVHNGCWEHPVKMLMKGEAKIAFQRFFDWDETSLLDYRYVYGIILDSARYPEIVGHDVLIPTDNVDFFVNPDLSSET